MSVFLLCKITETLESDSYRQSIVTAPGKVWKNYYYYDYFYNSVIARDSVFHSVSARDAKQ